MLEATGNTFTGAAGREPSLGAALERLGPLSVAFGQFLCWRADLVASSDWLTLRSLRPTVPPLSRSEVTGRLLAALGDAGGALAAHLEPTPCWSTPWRCGYRSVHDDRVVVVQVARDPLPESAFAACEAGLRGLGHPALRALSPTVWSQFREWARLADDPARERACLDAYGELAGETAVRLPVPIPELSAGRVLCWPWVDGRPASAAVGADDGDGVVRISEGLLDALLVLSAVDGDLDLETMAIDEHGRLVLHRATRLIPVPPAHVETALEYVSAVVADDDELASRLLGKLAGGRFADQGRAIGDAHWRSVPQARADLRLRRSAAAFEGQWRALSSLGSGRPLFLDAMHRSFVALGAWDAETPVPDGGEADRLEEAHWAVLGRLVRNRLDAVRTRGGIEWMAAAGLSVLDEVRQAAGLGSESGGRGAGRGSRADADDAGVSGSSRDRVPRQIMAVVVLLSVFLAAARWGSPGGSAWPAAVAAAAALGLFWVVSRMGDGA